MAKKFEIEIPTSWDDITIGHYIQLRPILATEMNDVSKVINILCVLTGKKREEIKELSVKQYHQLVKKMAFLKTELPKELKKRRFLVGGKWYEFKYEANKLLFGEYVNIMEILQKANNNEEVIYENLHKILTIICRPVYKTMFGYKDAEVDGEVIKETAENFFNNMPITIAYPIGVFFYNHLPILTETIKTSLMEVAEKKIKEAQEIALQTTGGGGH